MELFTKSPVGDYSHLTSLHVFGCPCYVLDPTLQDGKKLPKWVPRARRGQYLGVSSDHAGSIGRICNIQTGHISPQFHVVYDELFTTVPNLDNPTVPDLKEVDIDTLLCAHGSRDYYVDEDLDEYGNLLPPPALDEDYLTQRKRNLRR